MAYRCFACGPGEPLKSVVWEDSKAEPLVALCPWCGAYVEDVVPMSEVRAVMARVALRTMPDGSPCFCVVAVNPHHLSCACARAFIGHKLEAT